MQLSGVRLCITRSRRYKDGGSRLGFGRSRSERTRSSTSRALSRTCRFCLNSSNRKQACLTVMKAPAARTGLYLAWKARIVNRGVRQGMFASMILTVMLHSCTCSVRLQIWTKSCLDMRVRLWDDCRKLAKTINNHNAGPKL